jgi:hypothetical protein
MKGNSVLKSLDDIPHEMVEPEPDRPAPDYLEPIPAGLWEPQHVPWPVREWEHFESPGYPHWGINE